MQVPQGWISFFLNICIKLLADVICQVIHLHLVAVCDNTVLTKYYEDLDEEELTYTCQDGVTLVFGPQGLVTYLILDRIALPLMELVCNLGVL